MLLRPVVPVKVIRKPLLGGMEFVQLAELHQLNAGPPPPPFHVAAARTLIVTFNDPPDSANMYVSAGLGLSTDKPVVERLDAAA